ncbi:MAG: 3-hydroxyacyl-CoA dehydrogenase/enoyl-CoA hydratase family protein [Planctomycetes bacterium]|nr:3-hydroxyacyl-CoA dehydrogenase/enoyl-CoA hydratase family protein [Planctomycetota bacterium]
MSVRHRGRAIEKIAVIGSGQIGPDIALFFTKVFAPYGTKTVVVDVSEEALARGRAKLEKKIAKGVETGAFTPGQQSAMLEHVTFTSDYDAVRGANWVVEAATEDRALKGRIFAQVEDLVADDAILASNSSHLEPEVIFAQARRKERTLVIHYFFPAERNLMVEIVPSADTDPAVVDWLMATYEWMGKVPIPVKSRYGYALDPVFEGLFQASALLAESGVATTKQIDVIATKALGMTVGSFTAMNLTGGNPISNVGLDNYTSKIHSWFRSPASLKQHVADGTPWDTPKRGEQVEVPEQVRQSVTDDLRGAYFGLCGEIVDAGLVSIADFDMGLALALDMRPAFQFMNDLGTGEALRLVRAYAAEHPGFPVPRCIEEHGASNTPFDVPAVIRKDVDGVAVLTIRRPKMLNALDQGVFDELQQRVEAADADPAVRAIVLTGFGRKAFVSGADVRFLAKIDSAAMGQATAARSQANLNAIEAAHKPIVCAMNGLAFGGGLELAMACTVRVAQAGLGVLAGQPEANLGIIPGAGGTQRLPRLIGLAPAARMLRTARPISSEQALEFGLVAELVDGDLVARAIELAGELADGKRQRPQIRRAPLEQVPAQLEEVEIGHLSRAVDAILCKAILEGAKMQLADGIAFEAKCFGEVCATKDMRIGVDNFLANGPRAKAPFVHT